MGGNALKEYGTIVLSKENYDRVSIDIKSLIKRHYPDKFCDVISAYRKKDYFGDCDILIESSINKDELLDKIRSVYGDIPYKKNGNVLSIGIPHQNFFFQVDLISEHSEHMHFSYCYFSYNDLGNLIGRIAHKLGLKFGHDGLFAVVRDGNYKNNIRLTVDYKEAIEYLGFSYDRYMMGFDDLEDIFNFVIKSQYFNKEIYLLENRNHIARTRDKKRKTYMEFLRWINIQKNLTEYQFDDDKKLYIKQALEFFGKTDEYEKILSSLEEKRKISNKFNGLIVSELTGLTGKELGFFLNVLKQFIDNDNINLMELDQKQINDFIIRVYFLYNGFVMTRTTVDEIYASSKTLL